MWTVGFGSLNREAKIWKTAEDDKTTAVIQAAMHFEWTIKRVILKMGETATRMLNEKLDSVSSFKDDNSRYSYFRVWKEEVGSRYKEAALGTVLGSFNKIKTQALDVRGKLVHGARSVKDEVAMQAINCFFQATEKLRNFAKKHGFDVDERLSPRPVRKDAE